MRARTAGKIGGGGDCAVDLMILELEDVQVSEHWPRIGHANISPLPVAGGRRRACSDINSLRLLINCP
jgi:hypothetical protein